MKRTTMTDDSSKWFDRDKSIEFNEKTTWDGNNHISDATGSQWNHETLYFTKGGNWVLHWWSQYQGTTESYSIIPENAAIDWLISQSRTECDEIEELPKSVREAIKNRDRSAEL